MVQIAHSPKVSLVQFRFVYRINRIRDRSDEYLGYIAIVQISTQDIQDTRQDTRSVSDTLCTYRKEKNKRGHAQPFGHVVHMQERKKQERTRVAFRTRCAHTEIVECQCQTDLRSEMVQGLGFRYQSADVSRFFSFSPCGAANRHLLFSYLQ